MVTILDRKMPFKPTNAAHIGAYCNMDVMQVPNTIPFRTQVPAIS